MVSDSLGPAWQVRGTARDLIQQVMALEENLSPSSPTSTQTWRQNSGRCVDGRWDA